MPLTDDDVSLPPNWRNIPRTARIDYIDLVADRDDIVRLLLNHRDIRDHVDPERQLGNTARLRKLELVAILVALRPDPDDPFRRRDPY